jgi:hypothetical protein
MDANIVRIQAEISTGVEENGNELGAFRDADEAMKQAESEAHEATLEIEAAGRANNEVRGHNDQAMAGIQGIQEELTGMLGLFAAVSQHAVDAAAAGSVEAEHLRNVRSHVSNIGTNTETAIGALSTGQQYAERAVGWYRTAMGEEEPTPTADAHEQEVRDVLTQLSVPEQILARANVERQIESAGEDVAALSGIPEQIREAEAAVNGLIARLHSMLQTIQSTDDRRWQRSQSFSVVRNATDEAESAVAVPINRVDDLFLGAHRTIHVARTVRNAL